VTILVRTLQWNEKEGVSNKTKVIQGLRHAKILF